MAIIDLAGDNLSAQATFGSGGSTSTDEDYLLPATTGVFYFVPLRKNDKVMTSDQWDMFYSACQKFMSKTTTPDYAISEDSSTFGFGGANKAKADTNVEKTDQFTTTWNEQSGNYVSGVIKTWVYSKKNPVTGLSTVIPYTARNLSTDIAVFFGKPVMSSDITTMTTETLKTEIITDAFKYIHASPLNVPRSAINIGDRESSAATKFDTTWTFREVVDLTLPCNAEIYDDVLLELATFIASSNVTTLARC